MEKLLREIDELKNSSVKERVDKRIDEFKTLGKKENEELFSELSFCIMTANFNAERSIKIQDSLQDGFCSMPLSELADRLKELGHRFPEARAKYIVEARKHKDSLKKILAKFRTEADMRDWLADNVKGLGMKESSHFLRNIGFTDVAIIDFHIIDLLVKHGLVERPKTLTPKRYLEIEKLLKEIAGKAGLNLAELDLYLWYMETGKILK